MIIEFTSNKPELSMTLDGAVKVTLTAPKVKLSALNGLAEKKYDVVIKDKRAHRSLDANAYAWLLITAIADVLNADKEEIYLAELKKYGQSEVVSVKSSINVGGFFKYFEECGRGKVNGTEFTHYKVYKGSSEFDTREMSVFIKGVVMDAQELGIDTRTPDEIANMTSLWGTNE